MATPTWQVSGQYYETCSCDFVCPCILHSMKARPTKGTCTFAMGFQIERGTYGAVSLDGLGFIVLGLTPEASSLTSAPVRNSGMRLRTSPAAQPVAPWQFFRD
jgi:hypothetical protein